MKRQLENKSCLFYELNIDKTLRLCYYNKSKKWRISNMTEIDELIKKKKSENKEFEKAYTNAKKRLGGLK